jgi:hypothetical protein
MHIRVLVRLAFLPQLHRAENHHKDCDTRGNKQPREHSVRGEKRGRLIPDDAAHAGWRPGEAGANKRERDTPAREQRCREQTRGFLTSRDEVENRERKKDKRERRAVPVAPLVQRNT